MTICKFSMGRSTNPAAHSYCNGLVVICCVSQIGMFFLFVQSAGRRILFPPWPQITNGMADLRKNWCTHREPVVESSLAPALNAADSTEDSTHAFGEYSIEVSKSQHLTSLVIGTSQLGRYHSEVTDTTRGDRPPKPKVNQQFLSSFDSMNDECAVGSSGHIAGNVADYSSNSYRSSIAIPTPAISEPYRKDLQRANFNGGDNQPDGKLLNELSLEKSLKPTASTNGGGWDYCGTPVNSAVRKSWVAAAKGTKVPKLHSNQEPCGNPVVEKVAVGFNKPSYPVLIGNNVVVCNTKLFASLPLHDKYMVKERVHGISGVRAKLVLKSSLIENQQEEEQPLQDYDDDGLQADGAGERSHYRENCRSPGRIIFSCDKIFRGDFKYPLPSGKATDCRIGKGGNGFVFTMYYEKKQYAVKKTVYRPNEVNVHSALKHKNILPLVAVLMGEKHERHSGRFYCFHFMPKMDYDLRQILSSKDVGCLKHLYAHCSKQPDKFTNTYNNIKHILKETLSALGYLHLNGYVHRDVKASNIMIRMRCKCNPLYCNCSSKFQVKLGDFDSAGTVPGLGIKEPTDQMIKFASVLPLGTPGYRAPEVSMHITLSGPYETLYTFGVDMWSFGCLCLNICIGKTAALRQREEASLLLSTTHQCAKELWEKTTKIGELETTQPFSNDDGLLKLVRMCLQVNSKERPSASQAQHYLVAAR